MPRPLIILIALLTLLNLMIGYYVLQNMTNAQEPSAKVDSGPSIAADWTTPELLGLEPYRPTVTTALDRPLFTRDRRPKPAEPPQKEAAETDAGTKGGISSKTSTTSRRFAPVLMGLAGSSGSLAALVRSAPDEVPLWLKKGDILGGWHVADITPEIVILERDQQRERLSLYPLQSTSIRSVDRN